LIYFINRTRSIAKKIIHSK